MIVSDILRCVVNEIDEKVDYSLLENSISQDFGMNIRNLQRVQIGYSNKVFKGILGQEVVYVRIQKDKSLYPVEEAVYKALENQGIPVPKILAMDLNPKNLGSATMIMESAKGTPLGEAKLSVSQRNLVYEDAGKVLKRMHQIKLPSFGKLSLKDNQLVGQFQSFNDYMKAGATDESNFKYAGDNQLITAEEYKRVLEIWEKISNLSVQQAVLSHNDFHGVHVFTDGNKVTGVIDFTDARGEDPRWDLAMAMFFQNPQEREAFKKGYGDLTNDPVLKDYLIFVAVCKLGWRYKHGHLNSADNSLKVFRDELQISS